MMLCWFDMDVLTLSVALSYLHRVFQDTTLVAGQEHVLDVKCNMRYFAHVRFEFVLIVVQYTQYHDLQSRSYFRRMRADLRPSTLSGLGLG
jgi:hypothetical protein